MYQDYTIESLYILIRWRMDSIPRRLRTEPLSINGVGREDYGIGLITGRLHQQALLGLAVERMEREGKEGQVEWRMKGEEIR